MLPEPLSKSLYGFIGTSVLVAGEEIGAFAALVDEGPCTADTVARRTGVCARKLERLLNAGCSFGLVVKGGEALDVTTHFR